MIKKEYLLAEAQNIVSWFNKFKENGLKELSIKDQWYVLSNIKELQPTVAKFEEFRNDLIQSLRSEYFESDEKSEETQVPQTDENGNNIINEKGEILMQLGRKVKDEFMNEYKEKVDKINSEIRQVIAEKTEYELKSIDIDKIVESLPENTNITLGDIEMLSFCAEKGV